MTAIPEQFPVPQAAPPDSYSVPDDLRSRFQAPDHGGDTHSRYRYQATCVALYALDLLNEKPQHVKVYCELVEDVLLRHQDNCFMAIQVKTREKGQVPFKTSDSEILSTLRRFSDYEQISSQHFYRYVIATNSGFWHVTRNWQNLEYVKHMANTLRANSAALKHLHTKVVKAIKKKLDRNVQATSLAKVLSKLTLHDTLPGLGEERNALQMELRKHLDIHTFDEMDIIVADLVDFTCALSSREHEDRIGVHEVLAPDPARTRIDMRLASKSITATSLRACLAQAVEKARVVVRMRRASDRSLSEDGDGAPAAFENQQRLQDLGTEWVHAITALMEQLEWKNASEDASRMLVWLKGNDIRRAPLFCFEAYMLVARVEGEMARRDAGAACDTHLQTARSCLEKARVFSEA